MPDPWLPANGTPMDPRAALSATEVGAPITCSPEDWPTIRPVLESQALVWETIGGRKADYAAKLRAEIARLNTLHGV